MVTTLHKLWRVWGVGGFVIIALFSGVSCGDQTAGAISGRPTKPTVLNLSSSPPPAVRTHQFPDFTERGPANKTRAGRLPALPASAQRRKYGVITVSNNGSTSAQASSMPMVKPGTLTAGSMYPIRQLIYNNREEVNAASKKYKFNTRDRLRILVRKHPEFSGIVEVDIEGAIKIPNTEDYVVVYGLTLAEATVAVKAKIAPYIVAEPDVRLRIVSAAGQYYYIFGETRNRGRFPMGVAPLKLSEAIFRSNSVPLSSGRYRMDEDAVVRSGLTGRARFRLPTYINLHAVSVITPHRIRPTRRVYNVKDALYLGKTGEDPIIRPGQIIWVPSSVDSRLIKFFRRVIVPLDTGGALQDSMDITKERLQGSYTRIDTQQYRVLNRRGGPK